MIEKILKQSEWIYLGLFILSIILWCMILYPWDTPASSMILLLITIPVILLQIITAFIGIANKYNTITGSIVLVINLIASIYPLTFWM